MEEDLVYSIFKNNNNFYSLDDIISILNIAKDKKEDLVNCLYNLCIKGLIYKNNKDKFTNMVNFDVRIGYIFEHNNDYYLKDIKKNKVYKIDRKNLRKKDISEHDYVYYSIDNDEIIIKNKISKSNIEKYDYLVTTLFKDPLNGEYYIIENSVKIPVILNGVCAFNGSLVNVSCDNDGRYYVASVNSDNSDDEKLFYYDSKEWISNENKNIRGIMVGDKKVKKGCFYLCKIKGYTEDSRCYIEPMMEVSYKNIESEIIKYAYDHGFYDEIPENAKMEAKLLPSSDEINRRVENGFYKDYVDLTDLEIISIDPKSAMDLDDAIGITNIGNGAYRVCLPYADPSSFINYESSIFKNALKQGFTGYIPEHAFFMYVPELAGNLCSLNENGYKLTLTVQFDVDSKFNISNFKIYKAIIKNKKKMDYDTCNKIFETGIVPEDYKKYYKTLLRLQKVAMGLYDKLKKDGMIEINSEENKFGFNELNHVNSITLDEKSVANLIIEVFSLIGNRLSAENAYRLGIPYVFRNHEAPSMERINSTNKQLKSLFSGIGEIHSVDNSRSFQRYIDYLHGKVDKSEYKDLDYIFLRTLTRANYECIATGHYGLGFDIYGTISSTARKVTDSLNNFSYDEYLKNGSNSERMQFYREEFPKLMDYLNMRKLEADMLDIVSEYYCMYDYALNYVNQKIKANITFINDNEITIKTVNGISGIIKLDGGYYDKYSRSYIYNDRIYNIGDSFDVYFYDLKDKECRKLYFIDARDKGRFVKKLTKNT